jgi:regulator of sigma E protease
VLLTLAAVAVVLGVLVFVHEMGHFVAAKAVGIQVLRFSLGFGRPIVSWRRGETEYWISWLPLGGYVKMAGLEDEGTGNLEGGKADVPIDPARAFDRQPVWKRMIVVLAGVTINVLLAFVVYTGIAAVLGAPRLAVTQVDSVRTADLPSGAAALGSLKFGDRITAINGDSVRAWDDIVEHFMAGPADLRVSVAGRAAPIDVHLPAQDSAARAKAVQALVPLVPARIGFVVPGQPAARAGVRPGDVIVRVDQDTIRSWSDMLHKIWYAPERQLRLTVLRDGRTLEIAVTPEPQIETDSTSPRPKRYGVIGAQQDPPIARSRIGLGRAVAVGAEQTVTQAAAVVISVKKLLFRQASIKEVGGPILIAQMSGQAARLGLDWFLGFMAFFSVSLAVLNLLPIPVLDGGQAVFLIAEAVRRKPLSIELRTRLTQIGLVVILGLMLLGIANDLIRVLPR